MISNAFGSGGSNLSVVRASKRAHRQALCMEGPVIQWEHGKSRHIYRGDSGRSIVTPDVRTPCTGRKYYPAYMMDITLDKRSLERVCVTLCDVAPWEKIAFLHGQERGYGRGNTT